MPPPPPPPAARGMGSWQGSVLSGQGPLLRLGSGPQRRRKNRQKRVPGRTTPAPAPCTPGCAEPSPSEFPLPATPAEPGRSHLGVSPSPDDPSPNAPPALPHPPPHQGPRPGDPSRGRDISLLSVPAPPAPRGDRAPGTPNSGPTTRRRAAKASTIREKASPPWKEGASVSSGRDLGRMRGLPSPSLHLATARSPQTAPQPADCPAAQGLSPPEICSSSWAPPGLAGVQVGAAALSLILGSPSWVLSGSRRRSEPAFLSLGSREVTGLPAGPRGVAPRTARAVLIGNLRTARSRRQALQGTAGLPSRRPPPQAPLPAPIPPRPPPRGSQGGVGSSPAPTRSGGGPGLRDYRRAASWSGLGRWLLRAGSPREHSALY